MLGSVLLLFQILPNLLLTIPIGDFRPSSSIRNCWKVANGFRSDLKSLFSMTTLLIPLDTVSSPTDGAFSYCTQRINALATLYNWPRSLLVGVPTMSLLACTNSSTLSCPLLVISFASGIICW